MSAAESTDVVTSARFDAGRNLHRLRCAMMEHRPAGGFESNQRGAGSGGDQAAWAMAQQRPARDARRIRPAQAGAVPPGPVHRARSPRPNRTRLVAAVGFTVVAWASAFVAIRAVGADVRPGALTLGRLAVGVVLLGLLQLRAGWVAPTRREWLLLAGAGVAWFGVYNVALNAAEHQIDAGTAAMLVSIGPVVIALLAGAFLREGLPPWLIAGALVSLAGVAVIALAPARTDPLEPTGVLLCLLAAGTYSIAVILQKIALRRLPAVQVTSIACAAGAAACLPFTGQLVEDLASAPASSIAGVLYLGAVPTALAFSTWAYALARTQAGRLGVTTYLVPPVAIALSAILLGETPLALQLAGGALCLAGVALSRKT
jgi:drug/metabolite transporter (DMT)-like permease